jgi:hypothetical protein
VMTQRSYQEAAVSCQTARSMQLRCELLDLGFLVNAYLRYEKEYVAYVAERQARRAESRAVGGSDQEVGYGEDFVCRSPG